MEGVSVEGELQEVAGRSTWLLPILNRCGKGNWLKDFLRGAVDDGVERAVGVDIDGSGDGYWVVHCA